MMQERVSSVAVQEVRRRVFERGVKDGLAHHPAQLDPSLAAWAPALLRAYSDGYQHGVRMRPARPRSFKNWLLQRP